MKENEMSFGSLGKVSKIDRITRVFIGLAILFGALFFSIDSNSAFPLTNILASAVVLSGIIGWDPFYTLFRYVARSLHDLTHTDKTTLRHA
jgi:hypothetical protein